MSNITLNENLYDLWRRRAEWMVHTQRVTISGLHHIPCAGGAILASNHINWKDIFVLAGVVSRRISFVGTAELVDINVCRKMLERYLLEKLPISRFMGISKKFSNWAANTIVPRICCSGTIPVKRNELNLQFFEAAKEYLRKGKMLLIFPEGRTSKPERIRRFKRGMAKVVYDLYREENYEVPVIPAALRGTERFYLPGRRVCVHIARPFFIKDFLCAQEKLVLKEFNEKFREKIQNMLNH